MKRRLLRIEGQYSIPDLNEVCTLSVAQLANAYPPSLGVIRL
jgi:hypothetical protein